MVRLRSYTRAIKLEAISQLNVLKWFNENVLQISLPKFQVIVVYLSRNPSIVASNTLDNEKEVSFYYRRKNVVVVV